MANISANGAAAGPRADDDLSASWLQTVLRRGGHDVDVASFTVERLGGVHGLLADLRRIRLSYARGQGPVTVIAKFITSVAQNQGVGRMFGAYKREVAFYRDATRRTGMALPRMYAAEIDPDDTFVLLMEDLGHLRTGDQVLGCTIDEAAACIDELVKLHASFWNRVDDQDAPFAYPVSGPENGDLLCNACDAGWAAMRAQYPEFVPAFIEAARDRYIAALPAMQRWLNQAPITLIHSDFRLDNLMFGVGASDPAVVTLDWQGTLYSKGIQDVAFFLSQNLAIDIRRACERALVERWRAGLEAAGVTGYSTEAAWLDYRKAVLYNWLYPVVIGSALDATSERGRQMVAAMASRSAAALADLDCLSLLADFE